MKNKLFEYFQKEYKYAKKVYYNIRYRYNRKSIFYCIKRNVYQSLNQSLIKQNYNKRILVVLHLFYMDSWKEIKSYLKNLEPYKFDLYVSVVKGHVSAEVIEEINDLFPNVKLVTLDNKGYDIGSFIKIIESVKLKEYDIIIKLQSKGIKNGTRYVYGKLFKGKDWFKELFEGIIGAKTVHHTIDLFNDSSVGMVASGGLIVQDPPHKQYFVEKFCRTENIVYDSDYKFIAGTCFAISPQICEQLLTLGVSYDKFSNTERGNFSYAHIIERIICIIALQNYKIVPSNYINIKSKLRYLQSKKFQKYNPEKILYDDRFSIDYDAFYKFIADKKISKYKITNIKLKEIKRLWNNGYISLYEAHPYKYLAGDKTEYKKYCELHKNDSLDSLSYNRFDNLIESIDKNGFNDKNIVIVNQNNVILDGQHRSCVMLYKYGGEREIQVLKVYEKNDFKFIIKNILYKLNSKNIF